MPGQRARWLGGGLALAAAGAAGQWLATAADGRRYGPPGRLVDIGGRRLHLVCAGVGGPTVVLEAGLGGLSVDWSLVQPAVAAFTRVCAYDRAGYGWSDRGPGSRTAGQGADELRWLLAGAGLAPPYVLVGHSLGGLIARLYAHRWPDEVAGLVLVDASHEEMLARLPPRFRRMMALEGWLLHGLALLALLGLLRLLAGIMGAAALPAVARTLPPERQAMLRAVSLRARHVATAAREHAALRQSSVEARAAGSLGDRPLVVLTATVADEAALLPGAPANQLYAIHRELQSDLARRSSRGVQRVAQGSHHYIQLDRPEMVVQAIREVVEQARTAAPDGGPR